MEVFARDRALQLQGRSQLFSLNGEIARQNLELLDRGSIAWTSRRFVRCLDPVLDVFLPRRICHLDGEALKVSPGVTTITAAMTDPTWQKYIEDGIKATNKSPACPSNASTIQKFKILPRDFSVETEELTPTLKLKRSVACKNFHDIIEEMYK